MTVATAVFVVSLLLLAQCHPARPPENADVWRKVKMDLGRYDASGFAGTGDGKTTGNYEFCIGKDPKKWKIVQKIDSTAQKQGARGRVGCTDNQWLIIGSTRQPHFRRVLYELASQPFIESIEETFWE